MGIKYFLIVFSVHTDYFTVLSQFNRFTNSGWLEFLPNQPPSWCGQSLTYLDICTCDSRPRSMDYKPLKFHEAGKSSKTLPNSCKLCLDICLYKTSAAVSTSGYQVSLFLKEIQYIILSIISRCIIIVVSLLFHWGNINSWYCLWI